MPALSELFSRPRPTDAIDPRGSKTSREPRLHVEPSAEHRPNAPPRHLRREVPQQRQDGPFEVSILRVSDEHAHGAPFSGCRRNETGYYPPTPSVAGPARAPRDLSRDRARACARTRRGTISRPRVRADRSRRTAAARIPGARGEHHRLGKLATASRNLAKPGRTNTTTATAAEEPSGGVAPDPPKPFSGFSGFSGSAPSAPKVPRFPGARSSAPGSPSPRTRSGRGAPPGRAPRTTTKTPARTFGARRDARFRETRRDRVGVVRAHERLVQIQNHAQRAAFPRRRREKRAGTIGTRSGGGVVHPSANRAISGAGRVGGACAARRRRDGAAGVCSRREMGWTTAGGALSRPPGRAGRARGGARARRATVRRARESPNARRGGVRGDARFAEVHDPSSDGRGKGTPSRRGSATTGEGRRALVNSHLGRDTAGGDGATRSSRGTFLAAGSGVRARAQRGERVDGRAPHDTSRGQIRRARRSARAWRARGRGKRRANRGQRGLGMFLRRVPRRRKRAERMRGGPRRTWISSRATCAFASPRVRAHTRCSRTFAIARAYPRARRVRAVRRGRSRSDS